MRRTSNASVLREGRGWRWRHGRHSVAAKAREMIEAGRGLTDKQIEEFYATTDRIRQRRIRRSADPLAPFRAALEQSERIIKAAK